MSQTLLNSAVAKAVDMKASDIILTLDCHPVLKVNGTMEELTDLGILNESALKELVKEIVPESKQKDLDEERQVDLAYANGNDRFRVNVFYQRGVPSLVLRYVRNDIKTIDDLGLPQISKELVENDNGLILLVGPTGSGKSTSMAAMVQYINENFEKHIITIEDPIEYVFTNKKSVIQQREIGTDAPDFASALRAALREAPDVILLGEMRDLESVQAAITVAETGHLVISTVHANNAPGTIDRIIDIFPGEYKDQVRTQLADVLLAVFNQRLVPSADEKGVIAIVETMIGSTAVKNAIRSENSSQLKNIIQTSSAEGMHILDDLLVKAVARGEITKDSALEYADNREEVRKGLSTI